MKFNRTTELPFGMYRIDRGYLQYMKNRGMEIPNVNNNLFCGPVITLHGNPRKSPVYVFVPVNEDENLRFETMLDAMTDHTIGELDLKCLTPCLSEHCVNVSDKEQDRCEFYTGIRPIIEKMAQDLYKK